MLKKYILILCLSLLVIACGSSSSTDNDNTDDGDTTPTTGLRFDSAADFTSSASATSLSALVRTTTGVCADLVVPITNDDPILTDGLDCDMDGGVVAHVTPSQYSLALKRATLKSSVGGTDINFIPDLVTLPASVAVDFTADAPSDTIITIDPADLVAGTFSSLELEIYYFQFTFPVAGTEQNVRIYMSDDDNVAQGSLGHHQGDITFIDEAGTELGWIDSTWTTEGLSAVRTDAQNGAGGLDPTTGHARGFFGDEHQWNNEDRNPNDIFTYTINLDTPLEIPDPATITDLTTITATLSVADTFFFEDFANATLVGCEGFCPEANAEANREDAAWAPLAPTGVLTVE